MKSPFRTFQDRFPAFFHQQLFHSTHNRKQPNKIREMRQFVALRGHIKAQSGTRFEFLDQA